MDVKTPICHICQWQAGNKELQLQPWSQHCCPSSGIQLEFSICTHPKDVHVVQAGLGPAAAAIFLQPGEFGENLETSTLQNPVTDVTDAPEAFTAQYLSEVEAIPLAAVLPGISVRKTKALQHLALLCAAISESYTA